MAKLVLIDGIQGILSLTHRPGINNVNDFVSVHDDVTELGSAYETFQVINIPGLDNATVRDAIKFIDPGSRVSKYPVNIALSTNDKSILSNNTISLSERTLLLRNRMTANP